MTKYEPPSSKTEQTGALEVTVVETRFSRNRWLLLCGAENIGLKRGKIILRRPIYILLVQPWLDFRAQHLEIMVLVDLDTRFNENEGAFLSTGCNTGPHHNTQITQTLPL